MHMKKVLCTHLVLGKKFYMFQWEEGKSLSNHIKIFTKITCVMENIGIKLDDFEKMMALLCRLHPNMRQHDVGHCVLLHVFF